MVNEVLYTHGIAQTPWGGIKESGYGRTHGRMGLLELVSRGTFTSTAFRFSRISGGSAMIQCSKTLSGFGHSLHHRLDRQNLTAVPAMLRRMKKLRGSSSTDQLPAARKKPSFELGASNFVR